MNKIFLFLIFIIVKFNESYDPEYTCMGMNFTVGFEARFLCYGKSEKDPIVKVGQCIYGTTQCKMYTPNITKEGDFIIGMTGNITDKVAKLYFFVTPFCGKCRDQFNLSVSYEGINCGGITDNVHEIKNIVLPVSEDCKKYHLY
uniref:Uncharacterized protein n=1 Tax=Parastrongyloides trichosuri TaxID=131310 RepID=A0A0N4ZVV7_PARTI